ncbi:MAG: hypothetical protein ACFFBD_26670 [Candidatus Hodarchaeota archaeon]
MEEIRSKWLIGVISSSFILAWLCVLGSLYCWDLVLTQGHPELAFFGFALSLLCIPFWVIVFGLSLAKFLDRNE